MRQRSGWSCEHRSHRSCGIRRTGEPVLILEVTADQIDYAPITSRPEPPARHSRSACGGPWHAAAQAPPGHRKFSCAFGIRGSSPYADYSAETYVLALESLTLLNSEPTRSARIRTATNPLSSKKLLYETGSYFWWGVEVRLVLAIQAPQGQCRSDL